MLGRHIRYTIPYPFTLYMFSVHKTDINAAQQGLKWPYVCRKILKFISHRCGKGICFVVNVWLQCV